MLFERRKSNRFEIKKFVDVSFGHELLYSATGVNISETGLLCEVEKDIGSSKGVYILLELSGGETLDLTGKVVRVEKEDEHFIVAVEFTGLLGEDKKKLKEFVRSFDG